MQRGREERWEMGHFTPASSDLVRLRAQILINVLFLLFLWVRAGVDDKTLMSFGRRVLGFCTFVSYNTEKEARGLLLRKPVSGLPPCCSSILRTWRHGTLSTQAFISAESEWCFLCSQSWNHGLL